MQTYSEFVRNKSQIGHGSGFEPAWLPDFLFDFQRSLVEWAVRQGRAAIFADCGLGKTPMQLVWAENVVRQTNGRVLILTPLAVGSQTVKEAAKFSIGAARSRAGVLPGERIVVTNYEQLHYFSQANFSGVVCDESSILKNFDGKTKARVTEFMRRIPYRLLCTATAAPNDYVELGTSSEALGQMGFQDMVTLFFKQETKKDRLGWGRTKYRMRGHAEVGFWRWVCSWARACRKPSDLGFDDGRFVLPDLILREHEVKAMKAAPGRLFDVPAETLEEEREEQRRTLPERCEKVAAIVGKSGQPAVCWCHLNDEGDELQRLIPGSVQVSGSDSDDAKEEAFSAFESGQIRVLISKPKIAGFGLNWQHCAHMTFFPSHSFEQWYQSIRRCWRFGQTRPVTVDVITTDGGAGVLGNLQAKQEAAERMFVGLVSHMNESQRIGVKQYGNAKELIPSWL